MKQIQTIHVDEMRYNVSPFTTSKGVILLTDLMLILGQPMMNLIGVLKEGQKKQQKFSEMDLSSVDLNAIMSGLYARVDSHTLDNLFKRMLECTFEEHKSQSLASIYDHHFQGRYLHLFKVVFETFKVQYADFWNGLSAAARKA